MYKVCSRCQKVHPFNEPCGCAKYKKDYKGGEERKLRSKNAWTQKSLEIRERADNLCEVCRQHNRFVYKAVSVHHIEKVREHPELYLDNENLICLCPDCHRKADKGELQKEFLKGIACAREKRSSPLPD